MNLAKHIIVNRFYKEVLVLNLVVFLYFFSLYIGDHHGAQA